MMEVMTWVVGGLVGAVVVWVVAGAGVLEGGSGVDEGGWEGDEEGGSDEGRDTGEDEGGGGVGVFTGEEGSAGEEADEAGWVAEGDAVGEDGGADEGLAVPLLAIATAERKEKWTTTATMRLATEEYTVARSQCVCGSASEKCDCARLRVPGMRQARARRQPRRRRRWW